MTSYLGGGGGTYGLMLASFPGSTITATSNKASKTQDARMPGYGNKPVRASPASFAGERPRAGRMAETNSSQGDDHSISSLGASFMRDLSFCCGPPQFQSRPLAEFR